ncbi:hypothetical protein ACSS6W_002881 [Trichoderma asperelloides]
MVGRRQIQASISYASFIGSEQEKSKQHLKRELHVTTAIQFDIPLFAFANLENSHLMVDLSKIAISSDL